MGLLWELGQSDAWCVKRRVFLRTVFCSSLTGNFNAGDVWWLNRNDAFAQRLAYIDNNGRAVIKVDNTTNVPWNEKRNSVRAGT